jgi:hypothetical protein
MSIKSIDEALDFLPADRANRASWLAALRDGIVAFFAAIGEGLAASQRYEQLIARGVAPSTAVGIVFEEHYEGR